MDTSDLDRKTVLAMLGLNSSPQLTDKLKVTLKRSLMKDHMIYFYLGQLTNKELKSACIIILGKHRCPCLFFQGGGL